MGFYKGGSAGGETIKSIQRGAVTVSDTSIQTVSIANINPDKSIVRFFMCESGSFYIQNSGGVSTYTHPRLGTVSNDNFTFIGGCKMFTLSGSTAYESVIVVWEVIEFY